MFFKEKRCPICNEYYDEMADFCPKCKDENLEHKKDKRGMLWIPYKDQILNFIIGFIGINIVSFVATLLFASIYKRDEVLGMVLINTITYVILFIGILCYNFGNKLFPVFAKYFKDKSAYIFGIASALFLICGSTIFSMIAQAAFPDQINGNQDTAVNMISAYPIISIIVLGIIGPIVEELTYRVGLFNFMYRTKRWIAYLVEPLVFAILHLNFTGNILVELVNLPSYLFAGFTLTYIYEQKGPAASMTAHIINNMLSILSIIIALKIS